MDISNPADQTAIAKFCARAEQRFANQGAQARVPLQPLHDHYQSDEEYAADQLALPQADEDNDADFVAAPLKLHSNGQNYLLSADQHNFRGPQLMSWPPSQAAAYTLQRQISDAASLDFIASFMRMRVPRGQSYVLQ